MLVAVEREKVSSTQNCTALKLHTICRVHALSLLISCNEMEVFSEKFWKQPTLATFDCQSFPKLNFSISFQTHLFLYLIVSIWYSCTHFHCLYHCSSFFEANLFPNFSDNLDLEQRLGITTSFWITYSTILWVKKNCSSRTKPNKWQFSRLERYLWTTALELMAMSHNHQNCPPNSKVTKKKNFPTSLSLKRKSVSSVLQACLMLSHTLIHRYKLFKKRRSYCRH